MATLLFLIRCFTDEAWLHLSGYVNSQNYRTWRTENPHNYTETPLHPQKIGVWCAISRHRIIGALFLGTSINAEAYQELIQQFIALLQVDERNSWFQQDSATVHTAVSTMVILHEFFGENLIFKDSGHEGPLILLVQTSICGVT
jgi:hypothetical protein